MIFLAQRRTIFHRGAEVANHSRGQREIATSRIEEAAWVGIEDVVKVRLRFGRCSALRHVSHTCRGAAKKNGDRAVAMALRNRGMTPSPLAPNKPDSLLLWGQGTPSELALIRLAAPGKGYRVTDDFA